MTASTSRPYAGKPLAAVGVVVKRGREVLLVRRGRAPRQGVWTLPGGAIEWGETAPQAAQRELQEECGVCVEVERVLDVVDLIDRDAQGAVRFHYVIVEFVARHRSGQVRPGSDSADARWVDSAELEAYGLSAEVRRLIRLALAD